MTLSSLFGKNNKVSEVWIGTGHFAQTVVTSSPALLYGSSAVTTYDGTAKLSRFSIFRNLDLLVASDIGNGSRDIYTFPTPIYCPNGIRASVVAVTTAAINPRLQLFYNLI